MYNSGKNCEIFHKMYVIWQNRWGSFDMLDNILYLVYIRYLCKYYTTLPIYLFTITECHMINTSEKYLKLTTYATRLLHKLHTSLL